MQNGDEAGPARPADDAGEKDNQPAPDGRQPAGGGRFGLKARLLLALSSLALLTAVAGATAFYVFGDIGRAVTEVTQESLPGMVTALELAEKSNEIAIAAPALIASQSQEDRVSRRAQLQLRTRELTALIEKLETGSAIGTGSTERLRALRGQLSERLDALDIVIQRRIDMQTRRQSRLEELARLHTEFLNAAEPLVDDAYFDLIISGERITAQETDAITRLVEGGVGRVDRLLTLRAEANLASGLLAEAVQVDDHALLQPIGERFLAAAAAIERSLGQLPAEIAAPELSRAVASLLVIGQDEGSLFAQRAEELKGRQDGQGLAARDRRLARIKRAHERLEQVVIPLIDDAAFDLVLTTERVTRESRKSLTRLIDVGAQSLHVLLTTRGEANLAAGLLNQAAASTAEQLQPLRERFNAAEGRITRMLRDLPQTVEAGEMRDTAMSLLEMGKGNDGVFTLRRQELDETARAQSALQVSRGVTERMGNEVAALVGAARAESRAAAARSAEAIGGGKLVMILLTGMSVVGAGAVMAFYVGPRIVRPIERITEAMADLAGGDTSVDIPGRERHDELGRMASALGVFRDTAIEVQESNLREIREMRRRLSDAIESISEAFSLYDSDDRLVVCNSKYRSLLYPEIADEIVPGMTFEAIVRRAVERGFIQDAQEDPEGWLAGRLERHRNPKGPHIQQRGDGRWILVSERKTDDGGTVAVYSDITELKQREQELSEKSNTLEQLSNQLAKYLSPQVYESIFTGRQEVKVASRRKKLTVFFSDIAGFTETADRLESEELTELLNRYLTEMSKIALAHGATIDKYVGDAIVIFFGDPETKGVKEDALACVQMAIEMRARLAELQAEWRESGLEKPLQCRIGINTGFCTVGNFGSEDRMDYTIIGGGVNLASRLESAATPGEILISYETYALVKDEIRCEEKGRVEVKGIAYPVATYQVVGPRQDVDGQAQPMHEDLSHLKLSADFERMSEHERAQAERVLRDALARITQLE
ncbi:MAG: adenylate/guanylate cyclase domain-containing protein [Rhodovibrionaceae bacterium]|nr:adenylate/guanylate cyclase domain-containing protein [Rhodovibrionaceae bacterium]